MRANAFLGLTLAIGTREHVCAEEILEQAVAGGRPVGDSWALALALYGQGHVALVQGDAERVQERWQTCAAVAQGVGNLYGLSYLQFRWGVLALMTLDLECANACLRESLRLSAELDSIRELVGTDMLGHFEFHELLGHHAYTFTKEIDVTIQLGLAQKLLKRDPQILGHRFWFSLLVISTIPMGAIRWPCVSTACHENPHIGGLNCSLRELRPDHRPAATCRLLGFARAKS